MPNSSNSLLNMAVVVGALGYFVDIFDLALFGIVRISSLKELGLEGDQLLEVGAHLLNAQMLGMLLGGILWGVVGDKVGRVQVILGSILIFSIANMLNAFVTSIQSYAFIRFFAGLGLAGELGGAITLVSETLSKEKRGLGTAIVVSFGMLGSPVASLLTSWANWRVAYFVGGGLGFALLIARILLRVRLSESSMFETTKKLDIAKGNLSMLISPWPRFFKYVQFILIGVPLWFVGGVLITFAPELCRELEVKGTVDIGKIYFVNAAAFSLGDLISGYLSRLFQTRRKIILMYLFLTLLLILIYLFSRQMSVFTFYLLCAGLGFTSGYWAILISSSAERFGTNLRATVVITIPNFVRGSVVFLTLSFRSLQSHFTLVQSVLVVGVVVMVVAIVATLNLEDTYGKDLDYLEHK